MTAWCLHESLAITLYLAKKHGGPLAPANVAEDGEMTMWALWAATEVETHALNVLYHRTSNPKLANEAIEALRTPFAVLDAALAKDGHLVGGRFTVADINTAEVVRYAQSRARAVRRGAAREGVARRLPGAAGLQEDVGRRATRNRPDISWRTGISAFARRANRLSCRPRDKWGGQR